MSENCVHRFMATKEKGQWKVGVISTNNRGNPEDEMVPTTVFKCAGCGEKREYPDIWENNFVAPEGTVGARRQWKSGKRRGRPPKNSDFAAGDLA